MIDVPSIYIDTMVIIHSIEGHLTLGDQLANLASMIETKQIVAITSELTLAEVIVKPIRDCDVERRQLFEAFLTDNSTLDVVPVSRSVLVRAAELRAAFGAKLPDAIHAATAIERGCAALLTLDTRFKHPDGLRVLHLSELTPFLRQRTK